MTLFILERITFFAILLLSFHDITNAQFLVSFCNSNSGNYSILSNYGANINRSITQLASLASTSYFGTVTIGNGTNKVNALFYCRYDVTSDVCQSCVESSLDYVSLCPRSVESLQYHQDCTVRYSNLTIFSILQEFPWYGIYGRRNVSEDGKFNKFLNESITNLITDAIDESSNSSRYFATSSDEYSKPEKIYAIAYCTEDLTRSNCSQCLENGFRKFTVSFPKAYMGQIFKPSCRLSYMLSSESMSPPYNFTVRIVKKDDPTPPTSPPPGENMPPPQRFPDEEPTPPPPSLRPPGSTGTRGMPTTMASLSIVILCFWLIFQNQ